MQNKAPLKNLFLKEAIYEEAQVLFQKIDSILNEIGLSIESLSEDNLKKIPLKNLEKFLEITPYLKELSHIHSRIESSVEFISLKESISSIAKIQEDYQERKRKLYFEFKKLYSKVLNEISKTSMNLVYSLDSKTKEKNKEALSKYFSFEEFKHLIENEINDSNSLMKIEELLQNKQELTDLFFKIKTQVMSKKIDSKKLLQEYGTDISIEQIKDSDIIAYEFLRGKALSKVAMEKFSIEVSSQKNYEQRVVRPSDPLSKLLKLEPFEIAIFSISVDPIKDFGLKVGQKMDTSLLPFLLFEVENEQKQMKVIQKINIHLDDSSSFNIITPIYVSYIKAKLIKSQQNQSIKLL